MTVEIHGFCDSRFKPLEDAFRANFDAGLELGASLGVTWRGRSVVDLWAGWADPERTRPWAKDTIVPVASTTKVMTTIAALMLVDRGLLDLDAPVARYWPAFAQGGKEAVTVRDAFTHQAGVPGLEPAATDDVVHDWDAITTRIAAEPHWFGGRRQVIYHLMTFGFLLGELIRRVDGRRPAQFFREEIADKAGVDFQIGLRSRADLTRLATITPLPMGAPPPAGSLLERLLLANGPPPPLDSWKALSAEVPAGAGLGNGRSIARGGAILAMGGELDGVRYLSAATVREAGTAQVYGECPYLGWLKCGLGFGLDSDEYPMPSPTSMGWGGVGGSWAVMDPKAGVSLGYAPNNWSVEWDGIIDPRHASFSDALEALLPNLSD